MPGSQQYSLRLPLQMAHQVETLAQLWNVPLARVLRLAVETMLEDPDQAHALLGARYGNIPDSSTPQQREAANNYLASLKPIDWSTLVGGMID
jgi:hypothetical protein